MDKHLQTAALEAYRILCKIAEQDWDRPLWDEETGEARKAKDALEFALQSAGILPRW